MATIKCSACQKNASVTFCSETGVALCGDCAIPCDRCHIPLARTRVQVTSKGRKLCPKCMAERNAKRQARREQIKGKSRARKRAEQDRAATEAQIEACVAYFDTTMLNVDRNVWVVEQFVDQFGDDIVEEALKRLTKRGKVRVGEQQDRDRRKVRVIRRRD